MILIKIGKRIVNLDNVKFIELVKSDKEKEIRFYFIDGSFSYCNLREGEKDADYEFEIAWDYLNGLWVFSRGDGLLKN
jgi:hypothetical protein